MKFLKLTHSLLTAVLLAASVASCGEGDDDDDGDEPEPWEYPNGGGGGGNSGGGGGGSTSGSITAYPSEVSFPAAGGSKTVNIISGGPCSNAITNVSWANATVSGGTSVTITVNQNTSTSSRNTKVSLYTASGTYTSVAVTQDASGGGGSNPGSDPQPGTAAPSAPTGLFVASSGSAAVPSCTLKWNQSQGAASYIIYRSASENSGYGQIGTSTYPAYVDETVKIGNRYYYRVKAKNSKGTSDYSNTCVYDFSDKRKPGPAKITSATCSGSNITVRWSVPTHQTYGKPTSAAIMAADPNGGTAIEVKSFSASTTSATFNYKPYVLSMGSVKFTVRLSNEHGYSESLVIYDINNNKFYYN